MPRLIALLVVLGSTAVGSAADGLAGRWKFRIVEENQPITFLFAFSETDGKWVGDFVGCSAKLQKEPSFSAVTVTGDAIQFTLGFAGREFLAFDGVLAKDGKKLSGTMSQFGGALKLTDLYPSKLKKLDDPIDLAREDVAQLDGPEVFDAGFLVLNNATAKKLTVEEIRGITEKMAKGASTYGPRWERTVAIKLATVLAGQTGFGDIALVQARRAERMLTDDSPIGIQMEIFDTLATVLGKAGKADEAKKYAGMTGKLEAKDYADYLKAGPGFPAPAFAGRKGKSERAVVLEVFTGTDCPPCGAIDVACEGLLRAFQPTEAIVLMYHFHVPVPDALTSPDGMSRLEFYADQVRTAPTLLLNGKPGPRGGGPVAAGKDKFAELQLPIEKLLELPATVKLTVAVTPGEKGFTAKASVTDLEAPGEKINLRFVVIEDHVRLAGASGVRYHRNVVRALPGGVKGFALTKKASDHTVMIDVADIRDKQLKYLDEYAKTEGEFPHSDRPVALTGLKLVALIQNDATNEILQAVQIDLDKK